jgi:hypothetical protein
MDFLQQLLRGIAFVPALVNGIEDVWKQVRGAKEGRCDVVSASSTGGDRCRG